MYGLKHSLRACYENFDIVVKEFGFQGCHKDHLVVFLCHQGKRNFACSIC